MGRDIVFVLDVSKSMLANDLKPNRLEHAKLAISDCLDRLEGDRVALVLFAGRAVVKCPLTLDYGFFRMILKEASVNSVGYGGTMIGDAIRTCLNEVFTTREKAYRDIILITDGEDHGSFPLEAAKKAAQANIRLIAIGLGNPNHGVPITYTDPSTGKSVTVRDKKGNIVYTKLDAETLRKMALATPGGQAIIVGTNAFDLGDIYQRLVAEAEKKLLETEKMRHYDEKFQIFLLQAFILLLLHALLSERKPQSTREEAVHVT